MDPAEEPSLHDDELIARRSARAGLALAALCVAFGLALVRYAPAHVGPIARVAPFVFAAFLAVLALTRTSVRTRVTRESVVVSTGMGALEVPLRAIARCEVAELRAARVRGVIVCAPPSAERVVMIEWSEANRGTHRVLVGATDPDALAHAVDSARASLGIDVMVSSDEEPATQ